MGGYKSIEVSSSINAPESKVESNEVDLHYISSDVHDEYSDEDEVMLNILKRENTLGTNLKDLEVFSEESEEKRSLDRLKEKEESSSSSSVESETDSQ